LFSLVRLPAFPCHDYSTNVFLNRLIISTPSSTGEDYLDKNIIQSLLTICSTPGGFPLLSNIICLFLPLNNGKLLTMSTVIVGCFAAQICCQNSPWNRFPSCSGDWKACSYLGYVLQMSEFFYQSVRQAFPLGAVSIAPLLLTADQHSLFSLLIF